MIEFRNLQFRDAQWVLDTERASFAFAMGWGLAEYCEALNNGSQAVVIGFKKPRAMILVDYRPHDVYIVNLFTDPKYKRKGYALELVKWAIRESFCRHASGRVCLHVQATNWIAIKLYESLGFVVGKTCKNYYDKGNDALFMTYPK